MNMIKRIRYVILAAMAFGVAHAAEPTLGDKVLGEFLKGTDHSLVPLWKEKAPNPVNVGKAETHKATRVSNVSTPTMTIVRPKHQTSDAAVIIFPGGGYHILSIQKEGADIAKWASDLGITAVVLKYRVPCKRDLTKPFAPLQDAQRAIRLLRSKAKELKIDPNKIGVLGFSAGGHLAATLSHQADTDSYKAEDEIDKISSKPDFTVLIYPAYLSKRDNTVSDELNDKTKYANLPPMFVAFAWDDPFLKSCFPYLQQLRDAKKKNVELHILPRGGHGGGMQKRSYPFSEWGKYCERWLRDQKLIAEKKEH